MGIDKISGIMNAPNIAPIRTPHAEAGEVREPDADRDDAVQTLRLMENERGLGNRIDTSA